MLFREQCHYRAIFAVGPHTKDDTLIFPHFHTAEFSKSPLGITGLVLHYGRNYKQLFGSYMLPLKPFYLIRHGQSTANVRHITAGGLFDCPLTDLGCQQARNLAPLLKANMLPLPSCIYHSTMIRARDTAQYLNEGLGLDMVPDFDLREHDLGVWDGLPWADVFPHLKAGTPPPGGESTEKFADRVMHTLKRILITSQVENPPMIVAHGGLFYAIGFMYEYAMSDIQNCHLHYFEPMPQQALFPWHVWQFDIEDGNLIKKPAPFNVMYDAAQEAG